MRISGSAGYALLAVGYIAKNADKKKLVLAHNISKEYDIPSDYLHKILLKLVQANVLRSKRGPRGGFSLAKNSAKINLLQVIETIDGPMVSQLDIAGHVPGEKFCKKAEKVYEKAIAQARSVFQKAKVSDLLR